MKKIIFVADFFSEDLIGGGELNNEELINRLKSENRTVVKIHSHVLTPDLIEQSKDCFFIIANFIRLSEQSKNSLLDKEYVIYEHDHKYLKNRNPGEFVNYLSSEKNLTNKEFYKNSVAVFCQSKIHSEVLWKNLQIKNIINCSGNLWSKENIDVIKRSKDNKKKYECAILDSKNSIKNTRESIEYCEKNNLTFKLIEFKDFESYINELSECSKFVFFPKTLETLSRTSVEAKLLGCKLVTNKFLGVASEEWIKKDSNDILRYIEKNNNNILNKFLDCIDNKNYEKHFIKTEKLPGITIITSLFKSEKYLENFMKSIIEQTIFDECELLIINPSSSEKEKSIIKQYTEKFSNIRHIIPEKDPGIYGCWNIGLKESTKELVCNSNVDDLRNTDNLEILRKHLVFSKNVSLVYGDVSATSEQPILGKQYAFEPYEHSINIFSEENMIKCLPGPLPLWKKSMNDECGLFDESYAFAGDWEMWLRAVSEGQIFKKVDTVSGFYFVNPKGKSTDKEFEENKFVEEKEIFFKYKKIFGKNYYRFLSWFSRNIYKKKIIAFSLWGDNPKYTIGLIKNLDLAKEIYPGWICRVYCGKSVPKKIIEEIKKRENQELVMMDEQGNWEGMFWRFFAAEDADIMISRDADSRLNNREKIAVEKWIESDKNFHIMRDHPYHATEILGGMWGVKSPMLKNIKKMIEEYSKGDFYQVDQNFLKEIVYPLVKETSMIHDEFFEKKPFPLPRNGLEFVGKIFDQNDDTVIEHQNILERFLDNK